MAEKINYNAEEIKKLVKTQKLIIGTDVTLKELKAGNISKVFAASNMKEDVRQDFKRYCDISKAEFIELDIDNTELGTICRKPFSISVLGQSK